MTFSLIFTLMVTALLVASLYLEFVHPAVAFLVATVLLVIGGVITPMQWLSGFSNQQVIIIFMLVAITAGMRLIFGDGLFRRFFPHELGPRMFLARMMVFVSSVSAFLNNTPIVAFMTPYVRDWCRRTGHPASRFLMPLSFATILGGMITVIGTSTSLVLNGLLESYGIPALGFTDFVFLGLMVTVLGWVYLMYIGYHLLPDGSGTAVSLMDNAQEYIVETEVRTGSALIGRSVREAGLRGLRETYLIEIIRAGQTISPVSPEEVIQGGDTLFFSGHIDAIYRLIEDGHGLHLRHIPAHDERFHFMEAVVPAGSDLIGSTVRRSGFRSRFQASIVSIRRKGRNIIGRIGDWELASGDYLLLATGEDAPLKDSTGLVIVSLPERSAVEQHPGWHRLVGYSGFVMLLAGILNLFPLFYVCAAILASLMITGILRWSDLRRELDLGLLVILVCALALGTALDQSGAARLVAEALIRAGETAGPIAALAALFLVTTVLTSVITNTAVVAMVFPVALSMAAQLKTESAPFFVAIAFAASGDFATPIGYQTNLMVYGPGGYSFRDFFRVGGPFTILYATLCIIFISIYYSF